MVVQESHSPATSSASPPRLVEIGAALATGGLLTFMLLCNGAMAAHTTPLFASFTAHAVGTVIAGLAVALVWWRRGASANRCSASSKIRTAPFWAYLGGIAGALIVMLTSWSVNSPLALTGTLALGLAGQVMLALVFDWAGALGMERRVPKRNDLVALATIVVGTVLIILGRGLG
jgi:transporter family-2 protein